MKHFLLWFFWDPPREAFRLPFVGWPIVWYSILFAFGFFLGYFIFFSLLKRYFLFYPRFHKKEILDTEYLHAYLQKNTSILRKKINPEEPILDTLNGIIKDSKSYEVLEKKSKKDAFFRRITAEAAHLPKKLFQATCVRLFLEEQLEKGVVTIREKSRMVIDHLAIYVVLGTVVGARLGHFIFYEHPARYLRDPVSVLRVWEGGLASHGAIIGIILALFLFHFWSKKIAPNLTFISLLDLICIPTALVGSFIRVGNFFNQEISGTVTNVPWAVILGHPFDGSRPAPRHPVQLYEALFYLITFIFLWFLSRRQNIFLKKRRLIGTFFILVFSFRFFIEFFKEEQSSFLTDSAFTMGQILSLPAIVLGLFFLFLPQIAKKCKSSSE